MVTLVAMTLWARFVSTPNQGPVTTRTNFYHFFSIENLIEMALSKQKIFVLNKLKNSIKADHVSFNSG